VSDEGKKRKRKAKSKKKSSNSLLLEDHVVTNVGNRCQSVCDVLSENVGVL
jgi:hypothetical protein